MAPSPPPTISTFAKLFRWGERKSACDSHFGRVGMAEKRHVRHHLVVGEFVLFCALNNAVEHENVPVSFAAPRERDG